MAARNEFTVEDVKVWDIFVRVCHWTLVAAFFLAYLTGDDAETVHLLAGYLIGILVVMRLLWGIVGPRHARFASFVYRPRTVIAYGKDLLKFDGRRYLGHSPAGGAMVVILLIMLALIVTSGFVTLALREGEGPLAAYMAQNRSLGGVWEDIHEVLANITLWLVVIHTAGVLLASFVHGENLIKSMWTGRKRVHLD